MKISRDTTTRGSWSILSLPIQQIHIEVTQCTFKINSHSLINLHKSKFLFSCSHKLFFFLLQGPWGTGPADEEHASNQRRQIPSAGAWDERHEWRRRWTRRPGVWGLVPVNTKKQKKNITKTRATFRLLPRREGFPWMNVSSWPLVLTLVL